MNHESIIQSSIVTTAVRRRIFWVESAGEEVAASNLVLLYFLGRLLIVGCRVLVLVVRCICLVVVCCWLSGVSVCGSCLLLVVGGICL
jgi:hypothetical protein